MSLAWLFPLGLAALAALAVPLLLHLDRRRNPQVLVFPALRWLAAQARPRRSWRLVEWLLLALRLAMVAALALWFAHPVLRDRPRAPQHWVAHAPGLDVAAPASEADARHVWLAPGFPALEQAPQASAPASLSSLLRELDANLADGDTLEVHVPALLGGLDAGAMALSHRVEWKIHEAANAAETPAPRRKLRLALRYPDANAPALPYVRAAIAAWKAWPEVQIEVDEGTLDRPLPERSDGVLRLDDAAPDFAAVLDGDYPRRLFEQAFGDAPAPMLARAVDVAPTRVGGTPMRREESLRPALGWLAAALFLLERIIAALRLRKPL